MKVSFLLYLRLYFLKICYYVLNILSDLPRINKFFIRQKVYIGISIISLSLLIATSCDPHERNNNKSAMDTIAGNIKDSANIDTKDSVKNDSLPVIDELVLFNSKVDTIILHNGMPDDDYISEVDTINEIEINDVEIPMLECYLNVEPLIPAKNNEIISVSGINEDKLPKFMGGDDSLFIFIKKNLKYPEDAINKGISGRVLISFVVTETGEITESQIEQSLFPSLDAEALRIVKKMPKWLPVKQNGAPVKSKMTLPINFKLSDK